MKTKFTLIIILFFVCSLTFSQKLVADKFYENYAYIQASKFYLEALNKDRVKERDELEVWTKLGDCFYNNSVSDRAAEWYKKALDKYPEKINAEYINKYIHTLRSLEDYAEANEYYLKFKDKIEGAYFEPDLNVYGEEATLKDRPIIIENLDSINTQYSDFGSFVYNDHLFFASGRNVGSKVYKWNEQPYLDVFKAKINESAEKTTYTDIDLVSADSLNTDFHEASVVVTKDGQTMYFTRDNVTKRQTLDYDKKGTAHLKIYRAHLINGKWSNIEDLPFNLEEKSTGHPALSPDEKRLYFVSDRDMDENGTKAIGLTDIYSVEIINEKEFGKVTLLEGNVNTEGREMFPFITDDYTFYFSSDTSKSLNYGLLDIYRSDFLKGDVSEPINMKAPFNSPNDDFAFYINNDNTKGYFSSNRGPNEEKGITVKGNDDIYSFGEYICDQSVSGVVRDSENKELLSGATVEIRDENNVRLDSVATADDGAYSFAIECSSSYTIVARRDCYINEDIEKIVTTDENGVALIVDLELAPLYQTDVIVLNPITFVFDRYEITADGKRELENIITLMKDDEKLEIAIESHTDCRGKDEYNDWLSGMRANSTKKYFEGRGYGNRIKGAEGKGEQELKNKNCSDCSLVDRYLTADQIQCHKENRRSVFKIINQTEEKCE